jgi:exodeoxyribonuclease V alpha subunit
VVNALTSKFSVLTGGPGTGKTTILRALVDILKAKKVRVHLAAPTGRAAQRLAETTGGFASTIHRLLKYDAAKAAASSPTKLAARHRFPRRRRGLDARHAPRRRAPPGRALARPPAARRRHRPAAQRRRRQRPQRPDRRRSDRRSEMEYLHESASAVSNSDLRLRPPRFRSPASPSSTASRARARSSPPPTPSTPAIPRLPPVVPEVAKRPGPGATSTSSPPTDAEDCLRKVIQLCTEFIPQALKWFRTRSTTCRCSPRCTRASPAWATSTPAPGRAQSPPGQGLRTPSGEYRPGDKVIQLRNNYDKNLFNGDIGTVIRGRRRGRHARRPTSTAKSHTFDRGEFGDLALAYAISIHKSQGSEYPVVIVPLLKAHFMMLQRNLLYTAITRGKKKVFLVGEPAAYAMAVRNAESKLRVTHLEPSTPSR